jgi:hypothetical protein
MQAKEKYPQHISNSKENLPSSNNSDGPNLKKKCVNNHTTITSPSLLTALVLVSNWQQHLFSENTCTNKYSITIFPCLLLPPAGGFSG